MLRLALPLILNSCCLIFMVELTLHLHKFPALLLSDVNTSLRRVTVHARIARVWEFHKDNELAHVDLVFVDEQVYNKIDCHQLCFT